MRVFNKKSNSKFPSATTALLPAAILLGLVAQGAFAAGFQLKEDDVAGLGRANAGSTAAPDDAAVVFNNPAAMIDLRQPVIQADVTGVNFSTNFHGGGTDALGRPLTGGNGGDGGTTKAIPAIFFAMPVNDRFALGASVTVPFGFVTNYDPGWVGRYQALESKLESIDITVSAAYALTDQFSIGAQRDRTTHHRLAEPGRELRHHPRDESGAAARRVPAARRRRLREDPRRRLGLRLATRFPVEADRRRPHRLQLSLEDRSHLVGRRDIRRAGDRRADFRGAHRATCSPAAAPTPTSTRPPTPKRAGGTRSTTSGVSAPTSATRTGRR